LIPYASPNVLYVYRYNKTDKPRKPALVSARLLDQVSERLRYMHYSLQTEKAHVYSIRWYIRWHELKDPKDMGKKKWGHSVHVGEYS
jgi:hypothetical protein